MIMGTKEISFPHLDDSVFTFLCIGVPDASFPFPFAKLNGCRIAIPDADSTVRANASAHLDQLNAKKINSEEKGKTDEVNALGEPLYSLESLEEDIPIQSNYQETFGIDI